MESRAQTVPRGRRRDRQLAERRRVELADPLHRLEKELPLGRPRGRRLEVRPVAAGAAGVRALHPIGRRLDDRAQAAPPEPFSHLIQCCRDELSRQRAVHEPDAVRGAGDAFSGRRELLDADLPGPVHAHSRLSLGRSSRSRTLRRVSAFVVFSSVGGSMRAAAPASCAATSRSSSARSASGRRGVKLLCQLPVEAGERSLDLLGRSGGRLEPRERGQGRRERAVEVGPPRARRLEPDGESLEDRLRVDVDRRARGALAPRGLRAPLPGAEHRVPAVRQRVDPADGLALLAAGERLVDPGLDGLERHAERAPLAQQREVRRREQERGAAPSDERGLDRLVVDPILLGCAHR